MNPSSLTPNYVTLGKSLNHLVPQFSYVYYKDLYGSISNDCYDDFKS